MNTRTPIQERDKKLDILDHVNQDHSQELLAIAQSFSPHISVEQASLLDLFQEGLLLSVKTPTETTQEEIFVPFELQGELEEQILYLAYRALNQQGRELNGHRKRFFQVIAKQNLTPNLIRLTIQSHSPLPEYYPGYAYGLILKVLEQRSTNHSSSSTNRWFKNRFERAMLWIMKQLSSKNRQKLLQNMNKDIRLYTLRSAWKSSENAEFIDQGHIDIFTHCDSPGSQWASNIKINDIIISRTETDDKHEHLSQGQTVLIADETAYAAVAGILDFWRNPKPPYLIILSAAEPEQTYFNDSFPEHTENNSYSSNSSSSSKKPSNIAASFRSNPMELPKGVTLIRITCSPKQQGERVINALQGIPSIDGVWGAFENESAKQVRHYLRNQRGLKGKTNHIKGYWRLKSH